MKIYVYIAVFLLIVTNSYAQHAFSGGSGTQAEPFLIKTAGDLQSLARQVNAGEPFDGKFFSFEPANNVLNMQGIDFTPIGKTTDNDDYSFQGVFDGNGNKIEYLDIRGTEEVYGTGLFGYLGGDAAIRDLYLENCKVEGYWNTGALVGLILSHYGHVIIENCGATGSLVTAINEPLSVGGLIGQASGNVDIFNCYSHADIKSDHGNTGGLAGYINGETIVSNCWAGGAITHTGTTKTETGGIVGVTCILGQNDIPVVENCLSVMNRIEGTTVHRIVAKMIEGKLSNNYAYIEGGDWKYVNRNNMDGADWDGLMTSAPLNEWDPTVWEIDRDGRYMPKLRTIAANLQQNVAVVVNNNPSGINDLQTVSRIYGIPGFIVIDQLPGMTQRLQARVYSITGRMHTAIYIADVNTMIPAPKGLYIVQVGNSVSKVVVR